MWIPHVESVLPGMNREQLLQCGCLQAASGGCSTLARDSVLAVVPLGHFKAATPKVCLWVLCLQKPLKHGQVSLRQGLPGRIAAFCFELHSSPTKDLWYNFQSHKSAIGSLMNLWSFGGSVAS